MGTLKEFIDYIESKSGIQHISILYNQKGVFTGLTNDNKLSTFYDKKVIKFNWVFRTSAISCVIADELP